LDKKQVTEEDVKSFTEKTGIPVIETSAKSSYQINLAFETLTRMLLERR
jgi:hypothetical protein